MPDPSLTCPCSALRSGVASRRLLPTQNSGEPELLSRACANFPVPNLETRSCPEVGDLSHISVYQVGGRS